MSSRPFQLHVDSNLDFPLQENDTVSYGPLRVVKLEAGKIITVQTGIRLVSCNTQGAVVIKPQSKYEGVLRFSNCTYHSGHTGIMTVEIANTTHEFVRIEPSMHLFSFEFVPHCECPSQEDATQVDEPVDEPVDELDTTQVEETVSEVVDESVAEVVAETVSVVVAEPVSAVVDTPAAVVDEPKKVKAKRKSPVKKSKIKV